AKTEKHSTASAAWVDIVLRATMRSETVGPATRRTRRTNRIATPVRQATPKIVVIGGPASSTGERPEAALERSVDLGPVGGRGGIVDPHRVVLQLPPLPVEVDDLVVDDERGDERHRRLAAVAVELGRHDHHPGAQRPARRPDPAGEGEVGPHDLD